MTTNDRYVKDAAILKKAIEGWSTDEKPILDMSVNRTNYELQQILKAYNTAYGKDGLTELKSNLKGDFGKAVTGLFYTRVDFDCRELNKAFKGLGTNEDTVIEIIGSRDRHQLILIKARYFQLYNISLEEHVKKETSGSFKNLLVGLLGTVRNENSPILDEVELNKVFDEINRDISKKNKNDEEFFIKTFSSLSVEELRFLNRRVLEVHGKNLVWVLETKFSGDTLKLFKTVLISHCNPVAYFAGRIREACVGVGTKDSLLIRVILTRRGIDLKLINDFYIDNYKMTLEAQIIDETSGNYKTLLVSLTKTS